MTQVNKQGRDTDAEARNSIVSDVKNSYFVTAGAGSGKTSMLVNRMVAMVEAGIPINKISTITFTKAAAGEFYKRFQKELIKRSAPADEWKDEGKAGQLPKPNPETIKWCKDALNNINLCFMGTIDSFCQMVLAEHPYEARVPSDAHIITDEEAEAFYKQQYTEICKGEYDTKDLPLSVMAGTFARIHKKPKEAFVKGISFLMEHRDVSFQYGKAYAADLDRELQGDRRELVRLAEVLKDNADKIMLVKNEPDRRARREIGNVYRNFSGRWSESFLDVMESLKTLKDVRVLSNAGDLVADADKVLFDENEEIFEEKGTRPPYLKVREDGTHGTKHYTTRLLEQQYSISMTFLDKCVPVIEREMRDKGYLTFFDYLYYLREMLREDAGRGGTLIRHIYDRHSYFLIDEFQDTNPLQAEIFFYLTAENPVKEWSNCVPRPGSLFIVGDPKQSIYRFRSADISSFNTVRELFANQKKDSVLGLSRNFRSTRDLCQYFNQVFDTMFSKEGENKNQFEKIPLPDERDNEFTGIYTYDAYNEKAAASHRDKTDPERIAQIIEKLANNDTYLITTPEDVEPRMIGYKDFMVITSKKDELSPIEAALGGHRIPVKVEGKVRFEENKALHEVYRIYAAVTDVRDNAALYGALTGSLIGLTKEEIIIFKNKIGERKLFLGTGLGNIGYGDKTVDRVAEQIKNLDGLCNAALKLSPAALFSKIMEDFRIYRKIEADNLEVLYYTLEMMRGAEKAGQIISLKDGRVFIADILSGTKEVERCLSLKDKEVDDRVHLANLHKVKGLEAPIVILAATLDKTPLPSYRIEHYKNKRGNGYVFSVSKKSKNGGYETYFKTEGHSKQTEEKIAGEAENDRLVYVGATRARNALIFCKEIYTQAAAGNPEDTKWKDLLKGPTEDIFKRFEKDKVQPHQPAAPESVDAEDLYREAEESCVLNDRSREAPSYRVVRPSDLKVLSKMDEEEDDPAAAEAADDESPAKKQSQQQQLSPAQVGTMVHRLMEMLVTAKNKMETDEMVGEIVREFVVEDREDLKKEARSVLTEVAGRMRSGGYAQTNGLPQDLLGTLLDADEAYCEVPFCYKEGNTLWNGAMDVVYHSGGKWHIVDYKTNADGTALDLKYQEQLEAYRNAFKKITGQEADAGTYHIDI